MPVVERQENLKSVKPFTKEHPECRPYEIYLGNYTNDEAARIDWRSKRSGWFAYQIDGTPIPPSITRPWFVNEQEWMDAGNTLASDGEQKWVTE